MGALFKSCRRRGLRGADPRPARPVVAGQSLQSHPDPGEAGLRRAGNITKTESIVDVFLSYIVYSISGDVNQLSEQHTYFSPVLFVSETPSFLSVVGL